MTSSQSQNPYVYCMNNPLRYIDPSGMMGDIPDWSAPPDLFAGSVGTAESVAESLSDFLDGVINGCPSVDPADNEGRFDDIAGLPDAPPEGSPAGGNPGEDGEYTSPDYQCPIEIHLNFTATIISADYSVMYDQKTNRVVDRLSFSGGGAAGFKTISQLIDCAASPVGVSATVKNIDIDFDTYLNTPATHNFTAGYYGGVDVSVGDSNGDGALEVFSHGGGLVSPGVSTAYGAPFYSTPILTEGGVLYNIFH